MSTLQQATRTSASTGLHNRLVASWPVSMLHQVAYQWQKTNDAFKLRTGRRCLCPWHAHPFRCVYCHCLCPWLPHRARWRVGPWPRARSLWPSLLLHTVTTSHGWQLWQWWAQRVAATPACNRRLWRSSMLLLTKRINQAFCTLCAMHQYAHIHRTVSAFSHLHPRWCKPADGTAGWQVASCVSSGCQWAMAAAGGSRRQLQVTWGDNKWPL